MRTILTSTVSAGPLFEWFAMGKDNRARLRAAGYSDGRITNWKSRGIPRAEVGNIAPFLGMTYEEYVHAAEAWQLRAKKLRRVAVWAAFCLVTALSEPFDIIPAAHASPILSADRTEYTLRHFLRRVWAWIKSLFRTISDDRIATAKI